MPEFVYVRNLRDIAVKFAEKLIVRKGSAQPRNWTVGQPVMIINSNVNCIPLVSKSYHIALLSIGRDQ